MPTTSRGSSRTPCSGGGRRGAPRLVRARSGGRSGRLTVEQAYTRYVTRTATYLGATDFEQLVADLEIELGYVYRSAAVTSGADEATARPTPTRAPRAPAPALERPTSGSAVTGRGSRRSTSSAAASSSSPARAVGRGERSPPERPPPTRGSSSTSTAWVGPTCRRSERRSRSAAACRRPELCSYARTGSWPGGPGPIRPASGPRSAPPSPPRSAARRADLRARPPALVLAASRTDYDEERPREVGWGWGVRDGPGAGSSHHSDRSRPSSSASAAVGRREPLLQAASQ